MKTQTSSRTFCLLCAVVALLTLLFAGCKTTPKIDWNSRVGNYTYDQAIAEFGPPDKTAKLSDGKTVADWITHTSGGVSFGLGTSYWGGHSGVGMGESVGTGYGDRVLRLSFGPDNKLVSWRKSY